MKCLFLDIDGVLNSLRTDHHKYPDHIDAGNLQRLTAIMMRTDAKIVISSSWRHCDQLMARIKDRFGEEGYAHRIIGQTPDHELDPRCGEIKEWLDTHAAEGGKPIEEFAILDDDGDAGTGDLQDKFFQTTAFEGLTSEITERVIRHLNGVR